MAIVKSEARNVLESFFDFLFHRYKEYNGQKNLFSE